MRIRFKLDKNEKRRPLHLTVVIMLLIFLTTVFVANAARQWMWIQQISKDSAGLIPVDSNSNGLIDRSQSTTTAISSKLSGRGYISLINGTLSANGQTISRDGHFLMWMPIQSSNSVALCTYDSTIGLPPSYPVPQWAYCVYLPMSP
jgi:hypothetical protein